MTDLPSLSKGVAEDFLSGAAYEKRKAACESYYGFIAQHGKYIPFLTPRQLCKALSVSTKTLERWRKAGSGPAFIKTPHIRYPIVELEKWVRENLAANDTPPSSKTNHV